MYSNKFRLEKIRSELVDEIFGELITFKTKPYISYSVFKEIMFETNIHRTCFINLQNE